MLYYFSIEISLHQIRTRSKHRRPFLFVPPIPSIPSHRHSHHFSPSFSPLQSLSLSATTSPFFFRESRLGGRGPPLWASLNVLAFPCASKLIAADSGMEPRRSRFAFVLNMSGSNSSATACDSSSSCNFDISYCQPRNMSEMLRQ